MGNFFTSSQIYNNENLDKQQFIDKFTNAMSDNGYTVCDSDESEMSYILRFADNSKWVAVTSESYEQGGRPAQADAGRIAKMLGTTCVNTVVIDSDCAILELYDKNGKKADTFTIGRADDYFGDDIPQPSEKIWKSFLSKDSSWEQFIEICSKDEVFVEDSLSELAPVIGMDTYNITFTAKDADENDKNVVFLEFKKANTAITISQNNKTVEKSTKKLTLNALFKQTIGTELEKKGFTKIKSRYPYYVRVINHEIIHAITFVEVHNIYKNQKSFEVWGGVGTIYRAEYNFSINPKMQNWLHQNSFDVYWKLVFGDDSYKYLNKNISSCFNFSIEPNQMLKDMNNAFEVVDNVILYAMDKFKDIDSCLKHSELFNLSMTIYEDNDFGAKWSGYSENEGLLYVHSNNRKAITECHCRGIKYIEKKIKAGKHPPIVSYERFKQTIEDGYNRQLNAFDKIRNSEVLYSKALAELKQRTLKNKKILNEYGLNI